MRLLVLIITLIISHSAIAQEIDSVRAATDSVVVEAALPPAVLFRNTSFDDVLKEARKANKPLLLDFWATWCAPCRRLDRETFTDVPLGEYINTNFIPYRVNIDDFAGMDIVEKYSVKVYPTMLIINPADETIVRTITGFYLPSYLQKELTASLISVPKKAKRKK